LFNNEGKHGERRGDGVRVKHCAQEKHGERGEHDDEHLLRLQKVNRKILKMRLRQFFLLYYRQ
jgi:hypothetical protein